MTCPIWRGCCEHKIFHWFHWRTEQIQRIHMCSHAHILFVIHLFYIISFNKKQGYYSHCKDAKWHTEPWYETKGKPYSQRGKRARMTADEQISETNNLNYCHYFHVGRKWVWTWVFFFSKGNWRKSFLKVHLRNVAQNGRGSMAYWAKGDKQF